MYSKKFTNNWIEDLYKVIIEEKQIQVRKLSELIDNFVQVSLR